jgi:hypothetical protein
MRCRADTIQDTRHVDPVLELPGESHIVARLVNIEETDVAMLTNGAL